jgi:hypothetical protein
MPVPKNVTTAGGTNYVLYSQKWGDCRTSPYLFTDHWARLRAAAKALQLSNSARTRLNWIIWYKTRGRASPVLHAVILVSLRRFSISGCIVFRKHRLNGWKIVATARIAFVDQP